MERQDKGLAFMLQYENVAWYDSGEVRILDRRVYPRKIEFVTCKTHQEVTQAITDMVTQSAGPYTAAAMGMALAAYECRKMTQAEQFAYLEKASYTISHARPTTVARMKLITEGCLVVAKQAILAGIDAPQAIVDHTVESNNARYAKIGKMAEYLVDMFPQNGKVMTQCFGETIVGQMLRVAKERGNNLHLFCAETRPYFQGARLTATVGHDMGFDVTVISDNMPAWVMKEKNVDLFTSAADVITVDGHVVNKVGTFQIALAAKHWGIPYYTTGTPNPSHPDMTSVVIEERDPLLVMDALGTRTTMKGVKGF
ncbi:MAG: s-methyl-5-thioribose-1-phosphate isomerase, partial [Clostridia bacterium]|nr:s-methyl-5-thioribose-1-phosphate isomerase [Clostridia bacterium]